MSAPVVLAQVRELLSEPAGGDTLEAVDQLRQGDLGWEVHEQVDVVRFAVELDQFDLEVGTHVAHNLFHAGEMVGAEHLVLVLGDEDLVGMEDENAVPASANVAVVGHETN